MLLLIGGESQSGAPHSVSHSGHLRPLVGADVDGVEVHAAADCGRAQCAEVESMLKLPQGIAETNVPRVVRDTGLPPVLFVARCARSRYGIG